MAQNTQDLVKQIAALAESLAKLVPASDNQKETSVDAPIDSTDDQTASTVESPHPLHGLSVATWRREEAITAIALCAANGALSAVTSLIHLFNLTAEEVRSRCDEALQRAAAGGHLNVVEHLFEQYYADEDVIFSKWVLEGAAKGGHLHVVKSLLERMTVTDEDLKRWDSILNSAITSGNLDLVKYVVEKFNYTDMEIAMNWNSPFNLTVSCGNVDLVKYFVEKFRLTEFNLSVDRLLEVANRATQRYSITNKDGATFFQFASSPPATLLAILRADRKCSWLPFTKQWKCVSEARTIEIVRILKECQWEEGDMINMDPVIDYLKQTFGRPNYSEEELARQLTDFCHVKISA